MVCELLSIHGDAESRMPAVAAGVGNNTLIRHSVSTKAGVIQ